MDNRSKRHNIAFYLGVRYAIALLLISGVLLITYVTFLRQTSTADFDAYLVNISGRQRMLSQRISLLARELQHASNQKEAEIITKELENASEKMLTSHTQLSTGNFGETKSIKPSSKLKELYFSDPGIDQEVKKYTSLAEKISDILKREGIQALQNSPDIDHLVALGKNKLLKMLNIVVSQYEAEARERIERFKQFETLAFVSGILLLILEVVFIFLPVTKFISAQTAKLRESNEELLEFNYRMSHDICAPIKSTAGLIEIAEDSVKSGDQQQAGMALSHMKAAISKLDNLIEDISKLTRIRKQSSPAETIILEKLIDDSIKSASHLQGFDDVNILKDINVTSAYIARREHLTEILENLISNAIKYRVPGAEHSFLKISVKESRKNCIIDVIDNGLGIPSESQDKIFQMFKKFHPRHSHGSGLGLYIVYQNAQAIEGTVEYFSLPQGSQFRLTFPFMRAQ